MAIFFFRYTNFGVLGDSNITSCLLFRQSYLFEMNICMSCIIATISLKNYFSKQTKCKDNCFYCRATATTPITITSSPTILAWKSSWWECAELPSGGSTSTRSRDSARNSSTEVTANKDAAKSKSQNFIQIILHI